jgi:hypothetical protein
MPEEDIYGIEYSVFVVELDSWDSKPDWGKAKIIKPFVSMTYDIVEGGIRKFNPITAIDHYKNYLISEYNRNIWFKDIKQDENIIYHPRLIMDEPEYLPEFYYKLEFEVNNITKRLAVRVSRIENNWKLN